MTKRALTNTGSKQDHKSLSNIARKLFWIIPVAACIVAEIWIVPVIKNTFQTTGKDPTYDFPRISFYTADKAIEFFGDNLLIDKFSINGLTKVNEKYTLVWKRRDFEDKNNWYALHSTINYINNGKVPHSVNINIGFSYEAQRLMDLGRVDIAKGMYFPDRITDTENINGVEVQLSFPSDSNIMAGCFKLNGRAYKVESCCKETVLQAVRQILS